MAGARPFGNCGDRTGDGPSPGRPIALLSLSFGSRGIETEQLEAHGSEETSAPLPLLTRSSNEASLFLLENGIHGGPRKERAMGVGPDEPVASHFRDPLGFPSWRSSAMHWAAEGLRQPTRPYRKGTYSKGKHSFEVLARLDPQKVMAAAPHARRLIETLRRHVTVRS